MKGFYIGLQYLVALLVISGSFVACKKESGPVPTYIHIDSFGFSGRASLPAGIATTHQITAVWVYYNNNPVGVFDLPATIPIITSGTSGQVALRPGVANVGLNNFMTPYPFYTADTFTLTTQPGKVVAHTPVCGFASAAQFQLISNFDTTMSTGFKAVDGTVGVGVNADQNGVITLSMPVDTLAEDSSRQQFSINYNKDAFIEFDYKNTIPFAVGLRANLANLVYFKYYLGGVYASDKWQKFYLSVRDFAAQYKGDKYNFYIKASLPDGTNSGTILLDNIQLVYFN